MTGIVKQWNSNAGWGLIFPLIGKPQEVENVFVHKTALMNRMEGLPVGATVIFDLANRESGTGFHGSVQAVNVKLKKEKINANVLLSKRQESQAGGNTSRAPASG